MVPEAGQARHFEEILRDIYTQVPEDEMGGVRKLQIDIALTNDTLPKSTNNPCVYIGTPHSIFQYIRSNYISTANLQAVYILEADYQLIYRTNHLTDIFS